MDEHDKDKLRAALRILANPEARLDDDDLSRLGWNIYSMGYYGRPTAEENRRQAADIVFDSIVRPSDDGRILGALRSLTAVVRTVFDLRWSELPREERGEIAEAIDVAEKLLGNP